MIDNPELVIPWLRLRESRNVFSSNALNTCLTSHSVPMETEMFSLVSSLLSVRTVCKVDLFLLSVCSCYAGDKYFYRMTIERIGLPDVVSAYP